MSDKDEDVVVHVAVGDHETVAALRGPGQAGVTQPTGDRE
jgi:hypothetical protein